MALFLAIVHLWEIKQLEKKLAQIIQSCSNIINLKCS